MNEKRIEILGQAQMDAERERGRLAQEQAAQKKKNMLGMVRSYEEKASLLRLEVEKLEQDQSSMS